METPVKYFYGETLRWGFGFENPNKAAVLFACALPLLWWGWLAGWRIRNRIIRALALVAASAAILGATYCLCMTFSRGGLVAAGAADVYLFGYAWWDEWRLRLTNAGLRGCFGVQQAGRPLAKTAGTAVLPATNHAAHEHEPRPRGKWILSGLLGSGMMVCVLWTGLGERSATAVGGDASVGNRVVLWKSALQMSVENPLGFGAGKSGEQFMQWYQPLERDEGYRTMVNSYLTFLVERGWFWSTLLILGFLVFWVWTKPSGEGLLAAALRASIIGFMGAGLLSTTMEEWKLWIFPVVCILK